MRIRKKKFVHTLSHSHPHIDSNSSSSGRERVRSAGSRLHADQPTPSCAGAAARQREGARGPRTGVARLERWGASSEAGAGTGDGAEEPLNGPRKERAGKRQQVSSSPALTSAAAAATSDIHCRLWSCVVMFRSCAHTCGAGRAPPTSLPSPFSRTPARAHTADAAQGTEEKRAKGCCCSAQREGGDDGKRFCLILLSSTRRLLKQQWNRRQASGVSSVSAVSSSKKDPHLQA